MLHTRLKDLSATLLKVGRRCLAFHGAGNCLRESVSSFADGNEYELDPVAERFMELPQVYHLLAEDVSGETAEH